MSREARLVIPGIPHHITQRGNRRGNLFYSDTDRECFIEWLSVAASKWGLSILAYCLMTNHIHIEGVPSQSDSLHRKLKSVFTKYSMRLNSIHCWSGYVVQSRFFSSPLDDSHALIVLKYIEENPVRAKMVAKPADYRWSSAYARQRKLQDPLVNYENDWYQRNVLNRETATIGQLDEEALNNIRIHHARNLPIGSLEYVQGLEERHGRNLRLRAPGRPRKD